MGDGPARVVHLTKSLGLGGTEKTLQLLASHLDRSRFAVFVVALADGPRGEMLRAAGIPVLITDNLLKALQSLQPDIIHLHRAGWTERDILRPVALARARAVVETNVFGRHDPSPAARVITRRLFVSRFCRERCLATWGLPDDPASSAVLYNPVDTDFLASPPPGTPAPGPVAGRLSRPDPGKWSALALDMLPHLVRRAPDCVYRIVGHTPAVRDWVINRGLAGRVEFCEPLPDETALAGFLHSLRVMAHANDAGESFGLSIAEAMAAGLPVVTHPCPPPRDNAQLELVEHGRTGLVAATAEEYAGAVAWLLENPEQARSMGLAGQAKARAQFRAQAVARKLENIYQDLLAPNPDAPIPSPAPRPLCRVHG
ncbi:MAG: glycosyltransferase family 4 protein [Thermodesulfobacteriota bacterium]